VSLLSSNCAVIGLWPHGITVSRREPSAEETSTQTYSPGSPSESPAAWATSLAALEEWLADDDGAHVVSDIVVSDQFMRYLVLPWSSDLANDAEWRALARAKIDLLWGNGSGLDIRLDRPRYKRSRLVCAMESELRSRLQTLMRDRNHVIRSIQPHFTFAFNDVADELRAEEVLMVVSERDCATVAVADGSSWGHIRTLLSPGLDPDALDTLVNRERLLLGVSAEATVICGRYYPILGPAACC
jgi:hypothetical protein